MGICAIICVYSIGDQHMSPALEAIASYGASTTSYLDAVYFFRHERKPMTREQHLQGAYDILGMDKDQFTGNDKEAELLFLYTVQETIRATQAEENPDIADVRMAVSTRLVNFIKDNPWSIKEYDTVEDEDGEVSPKKKGAKKVMAEDLYIRMNDGTNDRIAIINAMIEELDMTKSGATTYFHNLKKVHGFDGPKTEKKRVAKKAAAPVKAAPKKKGPSKGQIAKDIFASMPGADKSEVIARIVAETGTSPAGANTYYCAAKRDA